MTINNIVFGQFYAGNNFTNKGVTVTPGFLFNNNEFIEAEGVIKPTDNFVFGKYSLSIGKQFLLMGNNADEDRCVKIKPSVGAAVSRLEMTYADITYKSSTNTYKFEENTYRINSVNMNYKLEIIIHRKPFDYFVLAGYNNGLYTGIGWRGILNKRVHK